MRQSRDDIEMIKRSLKELKGGGKVIERLQILKRLQKSDREIEAGYLG